MVPRSFFRPLDHEAVDDPVEDGVLVEAVVHVRQEILDGDGRFLGEELDLDFSQTRVHDDLRVLGVGRSGQGGAAEQESEGQDKDDLFQHGVFLLDGM